MINRETGEGKTPRYIQNGRGGYTRSVAAVSSVPVHAVMTFTEEGRL